MASTRVPLILAASFVVALSGCTRHDQKNNADRTVRHDEARPVAGTQAGGTSIGSADRSSDPSLAKPSPLGEVAPKRKTRSRSSATADRISTSPPRD